MCEIKNLKEIQSLEYRILLRFTKLCEKYKLRYCLCGGTLLGAIRHEGFIPWDDDIDIIMPRPDFDELIKLYRNERLKNDLGDLEIASYDIDKNYIYPVTKIYDKTTKIDLNDHIISYDLGVWVDIFVLDGVSENKIINEIKFNYQKILTYLNVMCITRCGAERKNKLLTYGQLLLYPIFLLIRRIGHSKFVYLLEKNAKTYSFDKSKFVAVYAGRGGKKEIMPKKEFMEFKTAKFEDDEFYIPGNYQYYLKQLYGDYMKLPPENKRNSRHDIKVFKKEV